MTNPVRAGACLPSTCLGQGHSAAPGQPDPTTGWEAELQLARQAPGTFPGRIVGQTQTDNTSGAAEGPCLTPLPTPGEKLSPRVRNPGSTNPTPFGSTKCQQMIVKNFPDTVIETEFAKINKEIHSSFVFCGGGSLSSLQFSSAPHPCVSALTTCLFSGLVRL